MLSGVILTPFPLDENTVSRVAEKFAAMFGEPVALSQRGAPELLAGIQVEISGLLYDGSLAGQLAALKPREAREDRPSGASDWRQIGDEIRGRLRAYEKRVDVKSAGHVQSIGDGIARLDGLNGCRIGELIEFVTGGYGIVMNLEEDALSAVLLGDDADVYAGVRAYGTGQVLSVPVGEGIIGRVIDPLGRPLDGKGPVRAAGHRAIESPAPGILDRQPVNVPLQTGLIAIDCMVPIGRGQRELIIGDRQTGKTSVAIDAILNQRGRGVKCVYVAIGQKASSVAQIMRTLESAGAMSYTAVVCSSAGDPATMQYIAPYCGCAMAEWFMYRGDDAFIVYDDLTKHAVAYRAMSLLLRRPPGREAYPGDVFYLHSRLLERAARLSNALGGGSMTALPIVETQAGDISAYIPTNVISITDGQIFLDTELFRAGQRPAVNVGLSVSRVGGAAQNSAMRKVSGPLRLELAQYRELQIFAQFSSDMDAGTRETLRKGALLNEMLRQPNSAPLKTSAQVAILYVLINNLLPPAMTPDQILRFKREFPAILLERHPDVDKIIIGKGVIDDRVSAEILLALREWASSHQIGEVP